MQLLVPLDDDENGVRHGVSAVPTDADKDSQQKDLPLPSSVMSENLRKQFETMKTVIRQVKGGESEELSEELLYSKNEQNAVSSSNTDTYTCNRERTKDQCLLDTAVRSDEDGKAKRAQKLKRKAEQVAMEIATAVDEEITRWRDGIADLEALLAAESEDESQDDNLHDELERRGRRARRCPVQEVDVPRFPVLARLIPDEDDVNGHGDGDD